MLSKFAERSDDHLFDSYLFAKHDIRHAVNSEIARLNEPCWDKTYHFYSIDLQFHRIEVIWILYKPIFDENCKCLWPILPLNLGPFQI